MEKAIINLHINNLIGQLFVVNIPSDQNKNSDQSLQHLTEAVTEAVVSAVSTSIILNDNVKETPETDYPENIVQN
ncbi:hypothetical protein [Chryseobacterium salviniae]|uniref:DUF2922 domain-containing protein n=1 Tax=Chryseobacterium salviniae TaxID=3101750 RepID=A0ABU6HSF3_9FLAO|nr:hypothetical protein [Chryseobacterium sp. T9W2-O]MEC3875971.1 hypothetical protein [Chryseobacterium sp. T9W2-O]